MLDEFRKANIDPQSLHHSETLAGLRQLRKENLDLRTENTQLKDSNTTLEYRTHLYQAAIALLILLPTGYVAWKSGVIPGSGGAEKKSPAPASAPDGENSPADRLNAISNLLSTASPDSDLSKELLMEKYRLQMSVGQYEQARETVNHILKENQQDPDALAAHGHIVRKLAEGDPEYPRDWYYSRAEQDLTLAIDILRKQSNEAGGNPFHPPYDILEARSDTRIEMRNFKGALEDLFEMQAQLEEKLKTLPLDCLERQLAENDLIYLKRKIHNLEPKQGTSIDPGIAEKDVF